MKLALISDIHGNLTALEAVLADMALARPDRVVCLGDVALDGPQPHQTVARLRALGYPTVMGNTDDKLIQRAARLAQKAGRKARKTSGAQAVVSEDPSEPEPPAELDDHQREKQVKNWTARQLSADDLAYMQSFVPTLEVALGLGESGQTLLCCHGSPLSYTDRMQAATPDATLAHWLADAEARGVALVASGHTHIQMLRRYHRMTLVNPGSVGIPLAEIAPGEFRVLPWAEYALITTDDAADETGDGSDGDSKGRAEPGGALHIELRRAPYDTNAVVAAYLASGMPHAEWMAADWRV